MEMQMDIRFKKCGISNRSNVCIHDDLCLSKFGALRGSCPHPGRQFVGLLCVSLAAPESPPIVSGVSDMHPSDCPNVEETRNPMQTFSRKKCSHFSPTNIPSAFPHEIPKCVSNNITYQRKARYAYCGNFFLLIVQHLDQKEPRKPVVCHYRHQIIDRRDERSGCNGRINMNFVEKHRDQRSHQA